MLRQQRRLPAPSSVVSSRLTFRRRLASTGRFFCHVRCTSGWTVVTFPAETDVNGGYFPEYDFLLPVLLCTAAEAYRSVRKVNLFSFFAPFFSLLVFGDAIGSAIVCLVLHVNPYILSE